jgi:hypothetical protein
LWRFLQLSGGFDFEVALSEPQRALFRKRPFEVALLVALFECVQIDFHVGSSTKGDYRQWVIPEN